MRKLALLSLAMALITFMAGCGSQSSGGTASINPPAPATVPVSLTVTDTPPTGVTVLFFQLNITSATLTAQSGSSVSLLASSNPVPVNVTQLQTDSAFLGTANITAGTYNSMSLTFSNPQLTVFNGSGSAIGSCANNTVCQLTPTAQNLTLTFSSTPFPVTVAANSPLAFKLDIHLDTVIQQDLSVNLGATNGVSVSQLPVPAAGAPVAALGNLVGSIQSVNSSSTPNSFVLQTGDGRSFTIDVNSSTTYSYPSSVCTADSFNCLAAGQIVKAEVSLQTGGTLLAAKVAYAQPSGQTVVVGNIIRLGVSNGNTMMDLILQQGPPTAASAVALPFGQRVTVTVPPSGVTYAIDSDSFTLPDGLTFTGMSSLCVGQQISAVVQGTASQAGGSSTSGPITALSAITFTTNSITLEPSQVSGSVNDINGSALSFTLKTNPNLFVPPAPTATSAPNLLLPFIITVQTTGATTFLPTTLSPDSILGLKMNDGASVKGWVFSTPTGATPITIAAEGVLDRGQIVPVP